MRQKLGYSFIILVALSLLMGALSIGVSLRAITKSNHKFCQVIISVTSNPVKKPSDPKANPSREQSWENYRNFVDLGRSLGC